MSDEQKVVEAPSSPELGHPVEPGVYSASKSPLITGTSTENQKAADAEKAEGEDKPAAKTSTARSTKS